MATYRVTIARRARHDLRDLPPPVQHVLLTVIETELRPWPRSGDPDEESIPESAGLIDRPGADLGLRWRRGVTRKARQFLSVGGVLDPAIEDACDQLVVFQVHPVPAVTDRAWRHACRFRVLLVLPHAALGPAVVRHVAGLARSTPG